MNCLTASEAKKTWYSLIDEVAERHEATFIIGKRNTVVLVSEEDWKIVQEACV